MSARLRCAIYTRKSSEEGLEQSFNSLHAQREACEAYVLSQTGEGWSAIKTLYDDGGFSGGSMERPGLKQLMADIARGLIDTVVVYKVDRLTRSLADFAKIVEQFDARGVSFVSVTQAFNTTSSMGRLTLNVLLSFAQFEREVTGERIRDKVAASKAKGMRMGGRPPLGYDIIDGRLAVNASEAETVRHIFTRYLELRSTKALENALRVEGVTAKSWVTQAGVRVGGGSMLRGSLNYLLINPAYRGVTRHKDRRYPDTHPAIIDAELWDRVQARLAEGNSRKPETPKRGEGALLDGLLWDDQGHRMGLVHTTKGAKRYRYYLSRAKVTGRGETGSVHRISAGLIEQHVIQRLTPLLSSSGAAPGSGPEGRVREAIKRVVVGEGQLTVETVAGATSELSALPPASRMAEGGWRLTFPFHLHRKQGVLVLKSGAREAREAKVDRALVRALVLARTWARRLEEGELDSIKSLATANGLCPAYTARLLPLAYLAPDLTEAILEGRQAPAISLAGLVAQPLPITWQAQRQLFQTLGG
jgi:DNA invertase Pin-like site-specific DNA recombinase